MRHCVRHHRAARHPGVRGRGPLALVETGDRARLDVGARRIGLLVPEKEIAARWERWSPRPAHPGSERGYLRLLPDTVTGADRGYNFDVMGRPAAAVPPAPSGRPPEP